jgi:hypothetical protein
MSAPQQGRQSPDPETQTGKQQQEAPATNPNQQGQAPSDSQPADASKDALKNLESNPKHVLQDEADSKTSKGS